jgi:DNA-binding NtrC family response regulator
VEFLPLRTGERVLGILGKILPVPADASAHPVLLPEQLVALRAKVAERYRIEQLTGDGLAMCRVGEQIRLASQTNVPVLIVGEPGTGKHRVARTIHQHRATRERTFVALDCARLPAAALSMALFGEAGLAGREDIGTLYLHEPSYLPRELQARLADRLRDERAESAPHIIAGCGEDPAAEVRAERLLNEFHHALSTLVISMPPLRDRAADLPFLVERLLARANEVDDRRILGLASEALAAIRSYPWPGNLRELYAVLASARAQAAGDQIQLADLPAYLRLAVRLDQTAGAVAERPLPLDQLLEQAERQLILLALRRARGNKSRAAEILSIWRPRLMRRMEALGIEDKEA